MADALKTPDAPELLAPAGDMTMLHAAVTGGADAVYLGLADFNARRNAANFDFDSLGGALEYCHLRGVKAYVAMNTLVLDEEMPSAMKSARRCDAMGVDGFIIQDLGLFRALCEQLPDAELHVSTQMSIHSSFGVAGCSDIGASRITFARELSLEEIENLTSISHSFGMETEVFVHGALCICYSGQCLMSSLIGSRSANRGLCAQACRLPYDLLAGEGEGTPVRTPGEHLLSPKDLCALERLEALIDAGVDSFKIEGRMKSPEYVHTTVTVYREAIDRILLAKDAKTGADHSETLLDSSGNADRRSPSEGDPELSHRQFIDKSKQRLGSVFSRGFTTAYMDGDRTNAMMAYTRPNNRGEAIGRVKSIADGMLRFDTDRAIVPGDVIEVWTSRGNRIITVDEKTSQRGRHVNIMLPEDDNRPSREGRKDTAGAKAQGIRQGDRIFRVRSAEAAFADDAREPKIPVRAKVQLRIGMPLRIDFATAWDEVAPSVGITTARDLPQASASVAGAIVEAARTREVTAEEVAEHIDRLGNTPFRIVDLDVDLDQGTGIGFSQLHHARAEALEKLTAAMLDAYDCKQEERKLKRNRHMADSDVDAGSRRRPRHAKDVAIAVKATNPECARAAKRAGADIIYVPALAYRRGQALYEGRLSDSASQAGYPKDIVFIMPAVDHDPVGTSREALCGSDVWKYMASGDEVCVESLGSLYHCLAEDAIPEIGSGLPLMNAEAVAFAESRGADRIWLSPELNLAQVRRLAEENDGSSELGITVFGAQELMTLEHCMLMSQGDCNEKCEECPRRKAAFRLKDRKGYAFPVFTDALGRSHVYNSVVLDTVPAVPELLDAGVSAFMIDATWLSPERCAQMTGRLRKAVDMALAGEGALPKEPDTTTGHLFRGVR